MSISVIGAGLSVSYKKGVFNSRIYEYPTMSSAQKDLYEAYHYLRQYDGTDPMLRLRRDSGSRPCTLKYDAGTAEIGESL